MSSNNPYVGPQPYSRGQKLYGRDKEAIEVQNLLLGERLVMLHSPSGAGKTSLGQAAVIELLEKKRFEVLPVIRMNRESSQARGSNRFAMSILLSLEPEGTDLEALGALDLAAYFKQRQRTSGTSKTLLIFDQFEEILTTDPTDRKSKEAFFQQLGDVLRDRHIFALFMLREDYVGELEPYLRPVPTRLATRFRLDLLNQKAAIQAIQGPARNSERNVDFTLEAATALAENLSTIRRQTREGVLEGSGQFVEPVVLQVVCIKLWETVERAKKSTVDIADVKGVGDVDQALADFYGEKVAAAARDSQSSEQVLRRWCETVLITAQGVRGQVLQTLEITQGLPNTVIDGLVKAHLLRREERRSETWYELAHDRLIDPVRRSNIDWLAQQKPLVQAAEAWEKKGGEPSYLYVGEQLREIKDSLGSEPQEVLVQRFLEACDSAQKDLDDKEKAEVAQERLIQWTMVPLGAVLIAFIGLLFSLGDFPNAVANAVGGMLGGSVTGAILGWFILAVRRFLTRTSLMLTRFTRKHRVDRSLQTNREHAFRAPKSPLDGSSAQEARTVQFAPFWIFMSIAGADGVITQYEIWAFLRALRRARSAAQQSGASYRTLFPSTIRERKELLDAFFADPRYAVDGLQEVGSILRSKSWSESARPVKLALLELARRLARRSDKALGEACYEFVEKSLEGAATDAKAVRSLYYRKSGLTTPQGILGAALIAWFGTAFIALFSGLSKLASSGMPGTVGVSVNLLMSAAAGAFVGFIIKIGLEKGKVRGGWPGKVIARGSAFLAWAISGVAGFVADGNRGFLYSVVLAAFAYWRGSPTNRDEPFCEVCEDWCTEEPEVLFLRPTGTAGGGAEDIKELRTRLERGQIRAIDELTVQPLRRSQDGSYVQNHPHYWTVALASCARCNELHTLTIRSSMQRRGSGCLSIFLWMIIPFYWVYALLRGKTRHVLIDRLLISAADAQYIRNLAARKIPPPLPMTNDPA